MEIEEKGGYEATPSRHSKRLELKRGGYAYQMGEISSVTTKQKATYQNSIEVCLARP